MNQSIDDPADGRCAAEDCGRSIYARGHCQRHYTRLKRHGNLLGKHPREDAVTRFWMRVDQTGDCWIWKPSATSGVYGKIRRDDGVQVGVHRFSYELHHGPIAEGLHVLHQCDTPPCVNPAHLRLGTRVENMQDMLAKGRGRPGGRQFLPKEAA